MTTISGLESSTTYSIEVAAVNYAGIGVYSVPTAIVTDGKNSCITAAGPLTCTYIHVHVHTCLISCEYKGHQLLKWGKPGSEAT